jgi:hypothetical protein
MAPHGPVAPKHQLQHDNATTTKSVRMILIPSGKRLHNYGKSPFLMGKLTMSMVIFNSYVKLPEGIF